jgi:hypothetical protein
VYSNRINPGERISNRAGPSTMIWEEDTADAPHTRLSVSKRPEVVTTHKWTTCDQPPARKGNDETS